MEIADSPPRGNVRRWLPWVGGASVGAVCYGIWLISSSHSGVGASLPEKKTAPIQSHQVADQTEVIGVVVNGRAKAYTLASLYHANRHVYNDLVGGTPVTVTFCTVTKCVRVYMSPGRESYLGMATDLNESIRRKRMSVSFDGKSYDQETGLSVEGGERRIPLDGLEHVRTTMSEWLKAHPDSEIYHSP